MLSLFLLLTFALPFNQSTSNVVNAADGVPIHYSVQGKGEPTLVFVHCWSCDRRLWENQVAEFSTKHRVVTIDLPGHGESGQARKSWSVASFGDDVKTVVTKLDLKRVVLIGSSMGGPISLEAARLMPDRVIGIVPVDTLKNVESRITPEQLEGVMNQMRADFKGTTASLTNQFFFSASTPEAVKKRVLADVASRTPEVALEILRAVLTHDARPTLREIKVPIIAINADLTPTEGPINRKYAPQFQVVMIKGTGHYPMLEDPARFNALLADAIKKISK
jgi:pimeloyl-ACP methyl ester carboxylesterase